MRVSCDPSDPGFRQARFLTFAVFCDGAFVPNAITADTEEGLVRYLAAGPDGWPVYDAGRGAWEILERRGEVEIKTCTPVPGQARPH